MLTDTELTGILSEIRHRMMNDDDGDLTEVRQENLNYYNGELDGTEREGYSKYVTREVMEAVEWALPSLLRLFTAGDKVVVFDPVGPEDEEQARQETDIVNHYLMKENNGFLAFYEWFKDALMYPNGYAKIYTEQRETVSTELYEGLTELQLGMVDQNENAEIIEATPYEKVMEYPQGQSLETCYDVKVKITKKEPVLRFEAIPPEQVLIDHDLTSVCLDEASVVCHRTQRTKSWLLEAGYDKTKLEQVGSDDDHNWNDERTNRLWMQDESPDSADDVDASMRKYWLEEWYIKVDYDEDGIAEARKVDVIGGVIFDNIEYDYQPIVALSSIPASHKHAGMSLGDLVKPIQRLSTFFARSINDNIARINNPRKYLAEDAITDDGATLDQLLDINTDVVLMRRTDGVVPEQHQPVINELLAAKQNIDEQSKVRTGVAPNLVLDPEILQQSTMGAFNSALEQANQRIETIARIFAETGVRDAMIKAHRQIKEHQNKQKAIRINGQWIEANPTDWRDRQNVTVNVGLGFNNKEKQIGVLAKILELQKEGLAVGLADTTKIYNTLEQMIEAAGLRNVDRYFVNPSMTQPPQPKPDPMEAVAQAQVMTLQRDADRKDAELKLKAQREAQELQYKAQKDQAELSIAAKQKSAELEQKASLAKADIGLKHAQTLKTNEEARAQDIENDMVESGVDDLIKNGVIPAHFGQPKEPEEKKSSGPKTIRADRTEDGVSVK